MKALSIKEPWANLIINGYKEYEFRSFNIKYRGKILIHASLKPASNINDFKNLNLNYQPGFIIGEAYIDDSLMVTPKLKEELKTKNPLVYSSIKGKYAWHLTNIKKYSHPIPAKGALNFWNYYSLEEVMTLMDDILYGWVAKNKEIRGDTNTNFSKDYILQTPKEVIQNKMGICWDQVELERYYLKNQLAIKTYFIVYYDQECPTHTFLTFKKDNIYYWFEHAWAPYKGIHSYSSELALLNDVKNKFLQSLNLSNYDLNKLALYAYLKPHSHITVQEFFAHCEKFPNIIKDLEK